MMSLVQINELRILIDLQYPHICVNQDDLWQFLNIPWEAKRFYKLKYPGTMYDKKGFFHNGKTTVWALSDYTWFSGDNRIKPFHIKIADREIPVKASGSNWSPDFSFENLDDANKIMRKMKLKAFW